MTKGIGPGGLHESAWPWSRRLLERQRNLILILQEKGKLKKGAITDEEMSRLVREQNEMFEKMAIEKNASSNRISDF